MIEIKYTVLLCDPFRQTLNKCPPYIYYVSFPTNVQAYFADAAIASEYFNLYTDINTIKDSIFFVYNGRKFVLKEVQKYFDSCSWYKGTIDAADFDVNVMNQYEGANLNLMVDRMNELD